MMMTMKVRFIVAFFEVFLAIIIASFHFSQCSIIVKPSASPSSSSVMKSFSIMQACPSSYRQSHLPSSSLMTSLTPTKTRKHALIITNSLLKVSELGLSDYLTMIALFHQWLMNKWLTKSIGLNALFPTKKPSVLPSVLPTTNAPTALPSAVPSSFQPSLLPTTEPTALPSAVPSSFQPSILPTTEPTALPSAVPLSLNPQLSPSYYLEQYQHHFSPVYYPPRSPVYYRAQCRHVHPMLYPPEHPLDYLVHLFPVLYPPPSPQ